MPNKRLSVSMIKSTMRTQADRWMKEYNASSNKITQEAIISRVFALEMLCMLLGWKDIEEELEAWRWTTVPGK